MPWSLEKKGEELGLLESKTSEESLSGWLLMGLGGPVLGKQKEPQATYSPLLLERC